MSASTSSTTAAVAPVMGAAQPAVGPQAAAQPVLSYFQRPVNVAQLDPKAIGEATRQKQGTLVTIASMQQGGILSFLANILLILAEAADRLSTPANSQAEKDLGGFMNRNITQLVPAAKDLENFSTSCGHLAESANTFVHAAGEIFNLFRKHVPGVNSWLGNLMPAAPAASPAAAASAVRSPVVSAS